MSWHCVVVDVGKVMLHIINEVMSRVVDQGRSGKASAAQTTIG